MNRPTIVLGFAIVTGVGNPLLSQIPSDAQVVALIRANPGHVLMNLTFRGCRPVADAASARGITSIRVLRRGTFNDQLKYWPVELGIDGRCTSRERVLPYHLVVRMAFHRDDFGDLKAVPLDAAEIRPQPLPFSFR